MKAVDFGDDKTFIENYDRLKSSRKMGELYGCEKGAVLAHAKKIGYNTSNNKVKKITNIPVEQVYADYLELKTYKKVAEKYGCSDSAVNNYLKKNGYQSLTPQKILEQITNEEFIASYEELLTAEKMGEKYNVPAHSIKTRAEKIGYIPPSIEKQYKLSEQDKENIRQAYYTKSSTELAKEYNVSRGMITKVWYNAGLNGKKIINPKTTEIDLSGQKFGMWTVLYKTDKRDRGGNIYWQCRCDCGIEKPINSASLRNGTSLSCGAHSNISKGNEKIKQILQEAGISFELEKKFSTCKDKKELPFDFFVNEQYLIEYDGEQHYIKNNPFDYEYTHAHDLIKSTWCKKNNIPLIRIPYTHFKELSLKDLLLETTEFLDIMPTIN